MQFIAQLIKKKWHVLSLLKPSLAYMYSMNCGPRREIFSLQMALQSIWAWDPCSISYRKQSKSICTNLFVHTIQVKLTTGHKWYFVKHERQNYYSKTIKVCTLFAVLEKALKNELVQSSVNWLKEPLYRLINTFSLNTTASVFLNVST